jgi:lipopolysaccharide biosynthesis protein
MSRVIAIYLPQFHPIPENDEWWGKGYTEWTIVRKAKPLFKNHYQPRIPGELGYYDLREPIVRSAQADLARRHGVEGFCYWHYYFGDGKRILELPFNEVLKSGSPDFPFCLGWANHSWYKKLFGQEGKNKLLIEQKYPGEADHINHFNLLLPAFQDHRYIKVDNKPVFFIYAPLDIPDVKNFIKLWQGLAIKNGLPGLHFIANTYLENIPDLIELGFDAVAPVRLFDVFKKEYNLAHRAIIKILRLLFKRGRIMDYEKCRKYFYGKEDSLEYVYPSIYPNWDHSPRSGRHGHMLHNSNPESFGKHVADIAEMIKNKQDEYKIVFLRSWNEWGEGNYIEPDQRYGYQFLEALRDNILNKFQKV